MTEPRYSVLQIGTYSSQNKGDAAMQMSTSRALRGCAKGSTVVISSPFPELDAASYRDEEVTRSSRRRLIWGTVQLSRALAYRQLNKQLGIDLKFLVSNEELQHFQRADLVVDLSGDMLTEDYGVHVAYSHYLPILTALALGKPVALCAQSIGPFKWTRALARRILNAADLVTARDPLTYQYLRELGVLGDNLRTTADMAFLLEPATEERIDDILREEGVQLGSRPVLGVSLSGLIQSKYEQKNPEAKRLGFSDFFAGIVDEIARELDCDVLFVSHVTGPAKSKDDRLVAQRVSSAMKRKSWVLRGDYRPDELKGLIRRTQLFFGARMHANIAALSSAVPTVAISYSHKTEGIMTLLKQESSVVNIANLTHSSCLSKLRQAWTNRQAVTTSLETEVARVKQSAAQNVELLSDLLNRGKEKL